MFPKDIKSDSLAREAWFRKISFIVRTSDLFFHRRFRSDFPLGDGRQVDDKTEWESKTYARARYSSSRLQSQGNSRLFTSTETQSMSGTLSRPQNGISITGRRLSDTRGFHDELAIIHGLPRQDNSRGMESLPVVGTTGYSNHFAENIPQEINPLIFDAMRMLSMYVYTRNYESSEIHIMNISKK